MFIVNIKEGVMLIQITARDIENNSNLKHLIWTTYDLESFLELMKDPNFKTGAEEVQLLVLTKAANTLLKLENMIKIKYFEYSSL